MGRHRPWLAAVLAVLVAGLGHAYLRRWRRALVWFVAILVAGIALSTAFSDPATTGPTDFPVTVIVPLLVLYGVSAADAFRIARTGASASGAATGLDATNGAPDREDATAEGTPDACPHCGKEVDPDLDFCTWCTEPLDADRE
ncbi:MAG: DUF6677 family protein [Haloferacaceae archaeon]